MLFSFLLCCLYHVPYIFGTPILGGVDAEENKYKFQVSLQDIGGKGQHFCGGSIISDSWILTAAHCFDSNERINRDIKRIQIVAGITYLSDVGDTYFIKSCKMHENWNKKTIANDIALLETTKKIRFSSAVQPIALASVNPPVRIIATLIGWGFTRDNMEGTDTTPISDTLQVAHFETISQQECRKQFNDANYPGRLVTQTNICISQSPDKGMCNGDSGGALTTNNGTQIGIVSFGGFCSEGVPGVMTSVANFLDWIKEKTGNKLKF